MSPSICILGDVMLDIVTYLNSADSTESIKLKNIPNKIDLLPGGTGIMFAKASVEEGFDTVHLIGKIGASSENKNQADLAGKLLAKELTKLGINTVLPLDSKNRTGTTMITYFVDGKRLLVADNGANHNFDENDITPEMIATVSNSDMLFVSGYSLLEPKRAKAIKILTEIARSKKKIVILDVVPHTIYRHMSKANFLSLTLFVDVIIAEYNTMRRLLFNGEGDINPSSMTVEYMAQELLRSYLAVIIQPSFICQYFADRNGVIEERTTRIEEYTIEQHRGLADRIIASLLYRHCDRLFSARL